MDFLKAIALALLNFWNGNNFSLLAMTMLLASLLSSRNLRKIALVNATIKQAENKQEVKSRLLRDIGYFYKGNIFLDERRRFEELFKITGRDPKYAQKRIWAIENYCKAKYNGTLPKNPTNDQMKKHIQRAQNYEVQIAYSTAQMVWNHPTMNDMIDLSLFKVEWNSLVDTNALQNNETVKFVFKGSSWLIDCIYNHKDKTAGITMVRGRARYYFFSVPITAIMLVAQYNGVQMWNGFGWLFSTNPYHWVRKRFLRKRTGVIKRNHERRITKQTLNYAKFGGKKKKK